MRKHFYHSVFPYFFIIFQSLKFWRFLRPLPSSVENGSECYCDVIEGARLKRSTRTSLEIFLLLFSVVAEQPILEEVSGFTEFLSLVIHGRKASKDDRNGWTLSSRGELNGSLPSIQRSAPYILKGKILLECLPFFPGRKSYLVLAWRRRSRALRLSQ